MREDFKAKRQEQIAQAAYDLLEEHGYDGISMLKIARRAKASNETLYRWYGDKKGLFHALVRSNAQEVEGLLRDGVAGAQSAREVLETLGPLLLTLLVSTKAVALNRAAAGDPSGELGAALAQSGRDAVMPLICGVFRDLPLAGQSPEYVTEIYLRLLVGDLQVRRVTGAIPVLSSSAIEDRARQAQKLVFQLIEQG